MGREFVHVCFGLWGCLVQVGANWTGLELSDTIHPEIFTN